MWDHLWNIKNRSIPKQWTTYSNSNSISVFWFSESSPRLLTTHLEYPLFSTSTTRPKKVNYPESSVFCFRMNYCTNMKVFRPYFFICFISLRFTTELVFVCSALRIFIPLHRCDYNSSSKFVSFDFALLCGFNRIWGDLSCYRLFHHNTFRLS